jgi:hypothetical protein
MRSLRLLWVVLCGVPLCALSADSAKAPGESSDPVQIMLDQLGKLSPAQQQAWLRQLEKRAIRAAQLTLPPDEAAQQQAAIRVRLHQQKITWRVLREVIADTNQREENAINQLVRRYRALVFDSFHKQTDTYEQRQQAWIEVHRAWRTAGSSFDSQPRLIDWLEAAIRSASPDTLGPIPETPSFFNDDQVATKAVKRPAKSTEPPAETKAKAAEKPAAATKPKAPEKPATPAKAKDKSTTPPANKKSESTDNSLLPPVTLPQ